MSFKLNLIATNLQSTVVIENVRKLSIGNPPTDFFQDHGDMYLSLPSGQMNIFCCGRGSVLIEHSEGLLEFISGEAKVLCGIINAQQIEDLIGKKL